MKAESRRWVWPVLFGLLAAATTAFIWYNSTKVGAASDEVSLGVADALNGIMNRLGLDDLVTNRFVRKAAHFLEYALLGTLLTLCLRTAAKRYWRLIPLALAAGLAVAIIDETIQLHVPGRMGLASDVVLDFAGVAAGAALGLFVAWVVKRVRKSRE